MAMSTTSGTTFSFSELAAQVHEYAICPFADYAIMLDGPWGCGKSFFINTNLGKDWKDVELTVVSLNGVQSLQELDTLIFVTRYLPEGAASVVTAIPQAFSDPHVALELMRNAIPLVSKKKFWTNLFTKSSNRRSKKDTKQNNGKLTRSPELLVVDDLERHSRELAVEDILGHLHERYVLKGTRILFVCDETEIRDKKLFAKCKEKYIRREYRFPELNEKLLFDIIDARYNAYKKPYAEVTAIVTDIIRLAKQFDVTNLRTICAIMDGYVELVEKLNTPFFFKAIGPYLVEHMFPLYNERCSGNLSAKDLANYGDLDQLDIVDYSLVLKRESDVESTQNSTAKLTYPEEFASRYEGLSHRWHLRKSVFRFVIGNELNEREFIESFSDRLDEGDPARKALETVFAFYEYDENPLQEAIKKVLSGIDADKYSLSELLRLSHVFHQIVEHNFVSDSPWSSTVSTAILNSVQRQAKRPMSTTEAESLQHSKIYFNFAETKHSKETSLLIGEILKIEKQSRTQEISFKLDKLFKALQNHDVESIWNNFPVGDSETDLLVRFVEAGYADRFTQLGTYGLRWLSQYVQSRLTKPQFFTSVKPIVEAINLIVNNVQSSIKNQCLTKPQKTRLTEFVTVLNEAREHLIKQPGMDIESLAGKQPWQ